MLFFADGLRSFIDLMSRAWRSMRDDFLFYLSLTTIIITGKKVC